MSLPKRISTKIQSAYEFSDTEMLQLEYTFLVLLYELSKLLIFTIFFLVTGKLFEFLICFIVLFPLRSLAGGIHFKHYLSCFAFSFCFFAILVFLLPSVHIESIVQLVVLGLGIIASFIAGPVPSKKRPLLTQESYMKTRFLTSGILLAYAILLLTVKTLPYRDLIFWTIVFQIIQIICARFARKGVVYEEAQ